MKTSIKTTITFINRRTKETQTESFYNPLSEEAPVLEQIENQINYWKFNIGKLGGHKILNCNAWIVYLR